MNADYVPLTDVLLKTLNEHIYFGPADACKCGWQSIDPDEITGYAHRAHVAEALATTVNLDAARVLHAAADDVRFVRENGLKALTERDGRTILSHPVAAHIDHWLRARADRLFSPGQTVPGEPS